MTIVLNTFFKYMFNISFIFLIYYYKDHKSYRHMEIFGKPENLDLAEYVFHFLYNQGEIHWEKFKKEVG